MPVLISANPGEPLSQGDLLTDLRLYHSLPTQEPGIDPKNGMGLVISRPCTIAHKPYVLVALVLPHSLDLPTIIAEQSVEKLAKLVTALRDADGSDAFYLGEIPGKDKKRYKASFDYIATLKLPVEAERAPWVERHRIATLDLDFRRDLHTRLFISIAKQGFDDDRWFSDADLEMIVQHGKSKASAAKGAHEAALNAINIAQANLRSATQQKGLESELTKCAKQLEDAEAGLKPYLAEIERRKLGESKS